MGALRGLLLQMAPVLSLGIPLNSLLKVHGVQGVVEMDQLGSLVALPGVSELEEMIAPGGGAVVGCRQHQGMWGEAETSAEVEPQS